MICTACGLDKEKFYSKNKVCVECFRKRRYEHRRNNPVLRMLSSAKQRAKRDKVPFDIEKDDIIIPEFCPVLGLPLKINIGVRSLNDDSPSLDKLIPHLGYVKGNIKVISNRANRLKGDASIEEAEKILFYLKDNV